MSDYNNFLNAEKKSPPANLSDKIYQNVMQEINPSTWSVALKFFLVHIVMGTLTLTICPQFGIGPVGGGQGLLSFVENYGHVACGLFCGFFFFFGSLVLTYFILTKPQKRVLNHHTYGVSIGMALLSFLTLLLVSHMINGHIEHIHTQFVLSWLASGVGIMVITTKTLFPNRLQHISKA